MSNINEKNLGPRWYVAHTYTGYENKVKANIEKFELEDEYFAASYLRYIREQSKDVKIEYAKYFESLDYATLLKREEIEA
jgi:transcription antitermination factor NusG